MAYLKFGHYVKSPNGCYLKTKEDTLKLYAFNDIRDVYMAMRPNDKVSFLIRHAERPADDWSSDVSLTETGIAQAKFVGEKLRGGCAGINEIELHSTNIVRTKQTAFLIAENRLDTKYQTIDDVPTTGAIDGTMYFVSNGDGPSYDVISKYAYGETLTPTEQALFNDIHDVTAQITSIIDENSNAKLNIFTSHDGVIVPYLVQMTNCKLPDLKFWQDHKWINFVAGIAIIKRENGTSEIYPIRGLDSGTFNPD